MKTVTSFLLHFYLPIVVSIFLILLILVSPKFDVTGSSVLIGTQVSVIGIKIPLPVWVEKVWMIRVALIAASLVSLLKAISVDFSKYFPKRLNMDLYFDEKGIERNLSVFSETELADSSCSTNKTARYWDHSGHNSGFLMRI